jgi:hypothetical protein
MKTINMPGFTAEASLKTRSRSLYMERRYSASRTDGGATVLPQIPEWYLDEWMLPGAPPNLEKASCLSGDGKHWCFCPKHCSSGEHWCNCY